MDLTLQAVLMDERRYGYEEGYIEGFKEGFEEGFKQGFKEGREEVAREIVLALYRKGVSSENIALDVNESLDTVTAILKDAGCIS